MANLPSPGAGSPAALIFDVDGTLYHQRPLRLAMLVRLAGHAALRPREAVACAHALRSYREAQEVLRASAYPDALRQVDVAAERCGREPAEVRAAVERWMEREPLALLPRFARPGLRALLERARTCGVRLGVFSDYPARDKLAALGVCGLFDVVVCAQDAGVGRFKPDATGLLRVADALGTSPSACVYVGDRPEVDGVAAQRAGMRCAIVTNRPAPAGATWMAVRGFPHLSAVLLPEAAGAAERQPAALNSFVTTES